jgi:hypothetical protein
MKQLISRYAVYAVIMTGGFVGGISSMGNQAYAQTIQSANPTSMDNWAGYALTGSNYSNVSASWVVPTVNCTGIAEGQGTASYAWVGLGGYSSGNLTQNSLEQIGSTQGCLGTTAYYLPFVEFYPNPPIVGVDIAASKSDPLLKQLLALGLDVYNYLNTTQYPVNAGDTLNASVIKNADGTYTLTESDTPAGSSKTSWTYTTTGTSPGTGAKDPGNLSAEVVMEQPGETGSVGRMPMANYSKITFSNISVQGGNSDQLLQPVNFSNLSDGNSLSNAYGFPVLDSSSGFTVFQL